MTNKEAANFIKAKMNMNQAVFGHPVGEPLKTAYETAISALEKQETAKIVIGKSKGGVTLWHECSKCGEPIDAKDIFCRKCGRKLIPLSEPYTEEEA